MKYRCMYVALLLLLLLWLLLLVLLLLLLLFFFFFQAEDGIRDIGVTGVQTCALPICFDNRQEISNDTYLLGHCQSINQTINPILIQIYPYKGRWPDLPHSNSSLSNSHSPSRLIHGILLQTSTRALALLLHLCLPRLLWSSLLPLPSSLLNTCPYHLTPFAFAI